MRYATALVIALAAAGCDGGLSTQLEGIYQIGGWTRNDAGCDAEGPSVLAGQSQQQFYLRSESYLGTDFLNVVLCRPDECPVEAAAEVFAFDGWAFESGSDASGWIGGQVTAVLAGGMCSGAVYDDTMTRAGAGVQIESRRRTSRPFPPDGDGNCYGDDAQAAAAGEPCDRLDVITASKTAPLP